jgi:lysophospholipase L1-like esterase
LLKANKKAGMATFGAIMALSALPAKAETVEECRAIVPQGFPGAKLRIATHTDFARGHYPARLAEFAQDPLQCGDIVMLGDSLTERQDWKGVLNVRQMVRNRGIAGDTTDGVLARLDEIIAAKPRAVFIMIGTNDLWSANSAKKTVGNIEKIILALQGASPETRIFVHTVFPIRSEPQRNDKVRAINLKLREVAGAHGAILVDTYSIAVDDNGLLRAEYTDDGVHLTTAGYEAWVTLLNATIGEGGAALTGGKVQGQSVPD